MFPLMKEQNLQNDKKIKMHGLAGAFFGFVLVLILMAFALQFRLFNLSFGEQAKPIKNAEAEISGLTLFGQPLPPISYDTEIWGRKGGLLSHLDLYLRKSPDSKAPGTINIYLLKGQTPPSSRDDLQARTLEKTTLSDTLQDSAGNSKYRWIFKQPEYLDEGGFIFFRPEVPHGVSFILDLAKTDSQSALGNSSVPGGLMITTGPSTGPVTVPVGAHLVLDLGIENSPTLLAYLTSQPWNWIFWIAVSLLALGGICLGVLRPILVTKALGLSLILLGIIFNPLTVPLLHDGFLASGTETVILILAELLCIAIGAHLFRKASSTLAGVNSFSLHCSRLLATPFLFIWRKIIRPLALPIGVTIVTIILCVAIMEWAISKEIVPQKFVIPKEAIEYNEQVNIQNSINSSYNPHGFNDRPREVEKPAGTFRVAVLGDSFVWGDGAPYEDTWPHQLEKMVAKEHPNVEVMSWGRCGWSTLDEMAFLKDQGLKYKPDMIILSWVQNDTDLGDDTPALSWHTSSFWKPLKSAFPQAFEYIAERINMFLYKYVFTDWLIGNQEFYDRLFSPEHLQKYSEVLKELNSLCKKNNIRLVIALCALPLENDKIYLDRIIPVLEESGLEYVNLWEPAIKTFEKAPFGSWMASLANIHPGRLLAEVYAKEMLAYIKKKNYLPENKTGRGENAG